MWDIFFDVNDAVLLSLLLILNTFHTLQFWCFHCWLWISKCRLRPSPAVTHEAAFSVCILGYIIRYYWWSHCYIHNLHVFPKVSLDSKHFSYFRMWFLNIFKTFHLYYWHMLTASSFGNVLRSFKRLRVANNRRIYIGLWQRFKEATKSS